MAKITPIINQDKRNLRDAVLVAISDLETIIANADTLTLDQARQAIKKLAQHQSKIIKFLATQIGS